MDDQGLLSIELMLEKYVLTLHELIKEAVIVKNNLGNSVYRYQDYELGYCPKKAFDISVLESESSVYCGGWTRSRTRHQHRENKFILQEPV